MSEDQTPEEPQPEETKEPSPLSKDKDSASFKAAAIIALAVLSMVTYSYFYNMFWTHATYTKSYLIVFFCFFFSTLILFLRVTRIIKIHGKPLASLIVIPVLIAIPLMPQAVPKWDTGYDSDSKSNLHNAYLGCKAYWAENGSDQECNVGLVSKPEIGFMKSPRVNIEVHGTETTFTATAQHMDSTVSFNMDANGNITGKQ